MIVKASELYIMQVLFYCCIFRPCLDRLDPVCLFIRFSDRDKFLFVSPNISAPEEKYSLCSRAIVLSHYLFEENDFASKCIFDFLKNIFRRFPILTQGLGA